MTEHSPRITDDAVARLPIHSGRADLLEEIMSTPGLDRLEHTSARTRRPAPVWVAVPAAAAAIAAIALVPTLRSTVQDPPERTPVATSPSEAPSSTPSSTPSPGQLAPGQAPSVPGGRYVALNAAGWHLTYAHEGSGETDLAYAKAGQSLELVQYPAEAHDSYYEDRQGVSDPAPTQLLGMASATFTYSADDHATIRPAENGTFLEVRGSGMGLAAYRAVLDELVQTDAEGLAGALPDDVVTPFNQDRAVAHLLEGVSLPDGFTAADVDIEGFNDAYQSAAAVAGSVGCAWLDVYARGGAPARRQALAALDGSRDWPLLEATVERGDYALVFLGVADSLRAGDPVAGVRQGIC